MVSFAKTTAAVAFGVISLVSQVDAQTFRRLDGCPTMGCVFPVDGARFVPGMHFDLRVEVHAPLNGTEKYNNGTADPNFSVWVGKQGTPLLPAATFFATQQAPPLERWNFSYYEDLFAEQARRATSVNVASRIWRYLSLNEVGTYTAQLRYNNGSTTNTTWRVQAPPTPQRRAKNVIFFISDGTPLSLITAARAVAHPTVNGEFLSSLFVDTMPVFGYQSTNGLQQATDSANSASALYGGKRSSVDALSVYGSSNPDSLLSARFETIAEFFRSRRGENAGVALVSTAYLADATPAALYAHTKSRADYQTVIESYLLGSASNFTWGKHTPPDVIMGGGAEYFLAGGSKSNASFYSQFAQAGYNILFNNSALANASNTTRTLGVFSRGNMAKWLDRNVYRSNLNISKTDPAGSDAPALDQPGLAAMTIKAIDVLEARGKASSNSGWFMMSEAGSPDSECPQERSVQHY